MKLVAKFWLKSGAVIDTEADLPKEITVTEALNQVEKMSNDFKTSAVNNSNGYIRVGKVQIRSIDCSAMMLSVEE